MGLLPHRTVDLAIRTDADRSKDATFLELPPDEQKLTRRPDAKVISDKDRVATSKAPQINREELKQILRSSRPGPPGENAPQPPPQGRPPPDFKTSMTPGSAIEQAARASAESRGHNGGGQGGDYGLSRGPNRA